LQNFHARIFSIGVSILPHIGTAPPRQPPLAVGVFICEGLMKKISGRWVPIESPIIGAKTFRWGYCTVIVEHHGDKYGWHLSISTPFRYPSWEEIKAARYDLLPHDITMAMLLPPPDEYVNVHRNCFHLHQIANDWSLVSA
jgi:hypothetical protein